MMYKTLAMAVVGAVALVAFGMGAGTAEAGGSKYRKYYAEDGADHPKARYYHRKKGTRVYGYSARRGGYSYYPQDVINTYGLSRSLYGSTNTWRNPQTDLQSPGGPFDHGFFFSDGVGSVYGGNSPYMH